MQDGEIRHRFRKPNHVTDRSNQACFWCESSWSGRLGLGDSYWLTGSFYWELRNQHNRFTMLLRRSWRAVSVLRSAGLSPAWKQSRNHAAAARLDLRGIYPPIATPFTHQEDVDFQKLEENLQKYAKIPFRGEFRHRPTCNKTQSSQTSKACAKADHVVRVDQLSFRNHAKKKFTADSSSFPPPSGAWWEQACGPLSQCHQFVTG